MPPCCSSLLNECEALALQALGDKIKVRASNHGCTCGCLNEQTDCLQGIIVQAVIDNLAHAMRTRGCVCGPARLVRALAGGGPLAACAGLRPTPAVNTLANAVLLMKPTDVAELFKHCPALQSELASGEVVASTIMLDDVEMLRALHSRGLRVPKIIKLPEPAGKSAAEPASGTAVPRRTLFMASLAGCGLAMLGWLAREGGVELVDEDGTTALMEVAGQPVGDAELPKLLALLRWLAERCDVNAANRAGETALSRHYAHPRPEALQLLLDLGARASGDDLRYLLTTSGFSEERRLLQVLGRAVTPAPEEFPRLLVAAAANHAWLVKHLVAGGSAPLDEPNEDGWTALHAAIARRQWRLVHRLCQWGACRVLPTYSDTGESVFHRLVRARDHHYIAFLLKLGITTTPAGMRSAMLLAEAVGDRRCTNLLKQYT